MKTDEYRLLTEAERTQLQVQGCDAEDWNRIRVHADFRPDRVAHVYFSGTVKLGCFRKRFRLPGGMTKPAGLHHVALHNCTVCDDVRIEHVSNYIANYTIEPNCYIANVNQLAVTERTRFGNGTEVAVLNETGGREVPIYNGLSAQLAYMIALYRHRPELIARLRALIDAYADSIASEEGVIGRGSRIENAGSLRNLFVGPYAVIEGASRLENGTLNSNREAPVVIGHNVVAENFICASGAHVTDGAALIRCFVGQGCHLGHLFSAHDSLFFSNCQGENGEACAIFAGPYTVSMHKSSLLIAGMFSFLNAGSGSNQSNHMYKLGPIHQGIVERGSKTTSDSYLLWPAKIGPFSLVMGRHVNHPDISAIPFSYLIEQGKESYLVPGVNLRSVGTIRDAQKWPKRDRRTDPKRLDRVNFNLLSPYTVQKMMRASAILEELRRAAGETSEEYAYQSTRIKNRALQRGIVLYRKAIDKFMGNSLIKRLEGADFPSEEAVRERLRPTETAGSGIWIDLSGLIAPKAEIEALIAAVETDPGVGLAEIEARFDRLHAHYYDLEWRWAWEKLPEWYGFDPETITIPQIVEIVERWKASVVSLDEQLYEDARKEFSLTFKTGFGMDGRSQRQEGDFEQVRGDFENNAFVTAVKEHIRVKSALGDELIARLRRTGTR